MRKSNKEEAQVKQFTRQEINRRLHEKVTQGNPIIIGGAGIGLVAKMADKAGIDLIMAYNTGPFRMDGHPSCIGYLAYGDSNAITINLGRQILPVVERTPVIAGIGAADPYRDIDMLIDQMMAIGFSGITNVPTAGAYDGRFRHRIDTANVGYPEEIKLIAKCRKKDIFTVAYAYTTDEVKAMIQAGVDVIGAHVGATSGGTCGFEDAYPMEEACERTQAMFEMAMRENPDVLFTCHGGPFEGPEEVQECFRRTDVHGFIGASSIERLPLERAIVETVTAFQSLRLRNWGQGEEKGSI